MSTCEAGVKERLRAMRDDFPVENGHVYSWGQRAPLIPWHFFRHESTGMHLALLIFAVSQSVSQGNE